jgi:hypothetical protein
MVDALEHQFESPERLYRLYAILNRIRLRSSEGVLAAAETATNQTLEQGFAPNPSLDELRKLLLDRPHDPLKGFSEACRLELRRLAP